jgi:xylulokinase
LECAPEAEGLVVSAQMHGLIFVDGEGRAVSRYISWQDQRALEPCNGSARTFYDRVVERVGGARLETGNELRPALPICVLARAAMRDELPAGAFPASLTDFVLAALAGAEPVTDVTNAAATGLLDLRNRAWHAGLVAELGLAALRWPEIVEPGTPIGIGSFGGRRLRLFAGIGDQQASLLGAGLTDEELSLNVATGSQVSRVQDELVLGDVQTRPYPGRRWLRTVTHLPAGRALNALIRLLTELAPGASEAETWSRIVAAVEETPETDASVNVCFFETAIGNRGAIGNLHEDNLAVGHLFRAAFRTMADNYARAAARVWPDGSYRRVLFSGGLATKLTPLRDEILARLIPAYRICDSGEDALEGLLVLSKGFA